jgi:nicotinamide mononucleotide transporter
LPGEPEKKSKTSRRYRLLRFANKLKANTGTEEAPKRIVVAEIAEAVAVALALAYLVLAIRENRWCWPAGMASTAIYLVVMYRAALYMETALQVFYLAVSVYGWRHWGRERHTLPITSWPLSTHALALALLFALSVVSGAWLASATDAAFPYLDSFIAWGSVVTTWMVARKVFENWAYWFVIDSAAIFVYLNRGLTLTAVLYGVYLVLVLVGWRAWRQHMQQVTA